MENGTNNRINAIHHKIKNVFFGNLLISTALNTTISKIITVPRKLICSRLIYITYNPIILDGNWIFPFSQL
ncbi:hypothetical protein, partial [Blautia obeum]|uniref:hypothetical protein n=1 Tax=Blautia obeum TaxID=40520 RepID=UPI002ED1E45C